MPWMLRALFCAAWIVSSVDAVGGAPHLTLDINTHTQPRSSSPVFMGKLGGSVYFGANTIPSAIGSGLFKTDGTSGGTSKVKDFNGLGVLLNYPSNLSLGGAYVRSPLLFAAGSKAYFAPIESATGQEIWVTDGTESGTHLTQDIYPGQGGDALMLGVVGTDLIFFESTSDTSRQIYKTDGTAAGTVALTRFGPAPQGSATSPQRTGDVVVVNGKMYFVLDSDLWETDGTASGTQQLPGSSTPPWHLQPYSLTVFGNSVLFIGFDSNSGGTVLFKLDPASDTLTALTGAQYRGVQGVRGIAAMNGYALFVGSNSQLWRTDGTGAGTVQIANFPQPSVGVGPFEGQDTAVTRVGDYAVFRAQNAQAGYYLWSTDGTTQGTVPLIADPDPTTSGALPLVVGVVGNHGYFLVSTASGPQIVATDGTAAGTHLLTGMGAITASDPGYLAAAGGDAFAYLEVVDNSTTPGFTRRLFGYAPQTNTLTKLHEAGYDGSIDQLFYDNGHVLFDASDAITGDEPWVSDGTLAGTQQLKNVMPESLTDDSHPAALVNLGQTVAFLADDGLDDGQIWISDGTAAGTTHLPNVSPADNVYEPGNLAAVDGALYFFAYGIDPQMHLMRVAKPGEQPQTLADLRPSICGGSQSAVLNGQLYFVAINTQQDAVYRTDGTPGGTVALTDQSAGHPCNLFAANNKVYFSAYNSTGTQLWSTDGTSAGTVAVTNVSGAVILGATAPPVLNGNIYFASVDTSSNAQLWKSDGTPGGTVATAAFAAGSGGYNPPFPVAVVNGKLLLQTAVPVGGGGQLWLSDGTAAGTIALNTPAVSFTANVIVVGTKAYFAAANSNTGNDPWVTDGTQAGTYKLAGVESVQYADTVWFEDFQGVVVFEVTQGPAGSKLFQTDGTQAGTKVIGPIGLTPYTQPQVYPREHRVVGQNLFFPAADPAAGAELFVLPNNAPVAAADTATSDKDAAVTINVLANDSDADGSIDSSTVQITMNPAHGSAAIGSGGSVLYTPTAGYSGQDTFSYTVTDNQGAVSPSAEVTVSVTAAVTVSSGGGSSGGSSGGGGGGGSIDSVDLAILMALTLFAAVPRLSIRPRRHFSRKLSARRARSGPRP